MCDLAFTGTDGITTVLLVGVAVLLVAVGAVLVLRGRLRGGKAKGAALAVLLLVGGIGLGTVSAPAPAQAADCSSSSGSSSDNSGGGSTSLTAALTVDPASWNAVAGGATQDFTITNTSTTVTVVNLTSVIPGVSDFAVSANSCGATLAPAATCTVTVTFSPTQPSVTTGSLQIHGGNTNDLEVPLSGIGRTTLTIGSTDDTIFDGHSDVTYTITNTGVADAVGFGVTLAMVPRQSDVEVASNSCSAMTTLPAGQLCTIVFSQDGTRPATTTITVGASNVSAPLTAVLRGAAV